MDFKKEESLMHDFRPVGDKGILIHFEQKISPDISAQIRQLMSKLDELKNPAVIEVLPAYATLCVIYDPLIMDYEGCKNLLSSLLEDKQSGESVSAKVFEIPVLYSKETGPDLEFVSEHSGLKIDEIISIHTASEYLIYMLGFAPGFPYLGGMDERIAAPRLKVPRQKIIPGSVGIAGSQTGMYPIESPGGWQLIGRTPVTLYDPHRNPPVYYNAGDYVKYKAIDEAEFNDILDSEKNGRYEVKTWLRQ